MKTNIFKIILVGLISIVAIHSANACLMDFPPKMENLIHADVVIVGKISNKTPSTRINIDVSEVLLGDVPDTVEVLAPEGFSPAYLNPFFDANRETYIFALVGKDSSKKWRAHAPILKSDQLVIMKTQCSNQYYFYATKEKLEAARKVLNDK